MIEFPPGFCVSSSESDYGASALDQADQNRNHRQYEQNVNESSQRVRADHAQQPEDQEQNGYSPEHRHSFLGSFVLSSQPLPPECTEGIALQVSGKTSIRRATRLEL
jgi:hypothetical protein